MKCPKCGYNSFEGSDICKKCSHDLSDHRSAYGLRPIVFQKETRIAMAEALATESAPRAVPDQAAEKPMDMFTFDLPQEAPAPSAGVGAAKGDPFSFDEGPTGPSPDVGAAFSFDVDRKATADKSAADVFADLLEPPGGKGTDAEASLAGPEDADAGGAYDLSNFSWDDTPEVSVNGTKKPVDDFDTLFGASEESGKK